MAHLTCETHKRRALVISPEVGPLTRLIHRSDGSLCGELGHDFVKYRGHVRTPFTVFARSLPKFQKPTRRQERERMLKDLEEGRVTVVQTDLPLVR